MNRLLYKLNEGIKEKELEEYYDYKEGRIEDYPEGNISDVTHSFVLSLSIFLSLLESNKIEEVKAVPYLPVRYASRYLSAMRIEEKEKQEEYFRRNNAIQKNITNKFIRTFRRVACHDKRVEITSYPYELDEFLTIHLSTKEKELENMLLEDASKNIEERIDQK